MKLIFILTFLLFSISGLAQAGQKKTISIFTMEITPFGMYRNNKPVGLYYDFANKIVEKAGFNSSNKIVPYARAHDAVVSGSADMTIMFDTEELLKNAQQSASILEFENLIISTKGNSFKTINELNGKRIGALRSGCYDVKRLKNINLKFIEFNDYYQGVKLAQSGRIDAICGSSIPMIYTVNEMNIPNSFFKHSFVASKRVAHVHFSKSLPKDIIKKLNAAIVQLKKENYFQHTSNTLLK